MPLAAFRAATSPLSFLIAPLAVVHASGVDGRGVSPPPAAVVRIQAPAGGTPGAAATRAGVKYGTEGLPPAVVEIRDAILSAVTSGRIEDLRIAIEMNEIKPAFTDGPEPDPIAYLKAQSADGEGREVLAALGALLEAGYVSVPLGRDLENNRIFVWPHFAETGLAGLAGRDLVDFARIVPGPAGEAMLKAGKYGGWRVGIGADGTWHVMSR